jgi:hypothetical protein
MTKGYQLPHGQGASTTELDGRPGDQVQLLGTAAGYYEWSTRSRRALDLELRARIVETSATIGTSPLVRWALELGHGDQVWDLPVKALPIISGTLQNAPIMPARGLLLRLSARRLKINFQGGFDTDGVAIASSKIAISVQPSSGDRCCNADWYTQYTDPAAAPPPPHVSPFPMGARMFQLRDWDTGTRFPALGCVVIFAGLAGDLFGPVDSFAAGYGDWTPIPVHAASMLTSVPAQIDYR